MDSLIRHIEYLLVTSDFVAIPRLGAIAAHTVPARVDESRSVVLPPRRVYTFDRSMDYDDGKLAASYARANAISVDEAKTAVAEQTDRLLLALRQSGRVVLGHIGTLAIDGGVPSFTPSTQSQSYSPTTMWLPKVELRTLADIIRERHALQDIRRRSHGRGRIIYYTARTARVAASLALLVALGFVLSTPIEIKNAQYASLGIENLRPAAKSDRADLLIRRPGVAEAPLRLVLDTHLDACETVDTAAHNAYVRERQFYKAIVEQSAPSPDDKYFLIVASFATQSDAQTFINQSGVSNLGILNKDGRYRVYAASGQTIEQTQAAAKTVEQHFAETWVCRK